MKPALSQCILMEAIISKMDCEISMLMGYYHTIKNIGPKRLSPTSGLMGTFSCVDGGKGQYVMLDN